MYGVEGNGPDGEQPYLRRNIFGMAPLRDALSAIGMCYSEEYGAPQWSDVPKWSDVLRDCDGDEEEAQRRYEAVVQPVLSWRAERPGIPVRKLCSNDGWHVTREECEDVVKAIEEFLAMDPDQRNSNYPIEVYEEFTKYDQDVLVFFKACAAGDGFRVW